MNMELFLYAGLAVWFAVWFIKQRNARLAQRAKIIEAWNREVFERIEKATDEEYDAWLKTVFGEDYKEQMKGGGLGD